MTVPNPARMAAALVLFCGLLCAAAAAAGQTSYGFRLRDYFAPTLGDDGTPIAAIKRIEITLLSRPAFADIRIIQSSSFEDDAPDGFGVDVPAEIGQWNAASGLYCYISISDGTAFKIAYDDDITSRLEPVTGAAQSAMARLAEQIRAATKDLTPARMGAGLARDFPDSGFAALDQVLTIPGGCNRNDIVRLLTPVWQGARFIAARR